MSKENEALERLKTAPSFMGGTEKYIFSTNSQLSLLEDYEIVKQALQRLEAIEKAKPSEALKYVNGKIADLEDELQHYTMVEKDKVKEFFIKEDLKQFTNIQQTLLKVQEQKKVLEIIKESNNAVKDLKALEDLYDIRNELTEIGDNDEIIIPFEEKFDLIEQELLEKEKQDKVLEVLEILKEKPFILQKIFEHKGLSNQEEYDKKFFWGTITEDERLKVKEWLEKDAHSK